MQRFSFDFIYKLIWIYYQQLIDLINNNNNNNNNNDWINNINEYVVNISDILQRFSFDLIMWFDHFCCYYSFGSEPLSIRQKEPVARLSHKLQHWYQI